MPISEVTPEVTSRVFQGKIGAAFAIALLLVPIAFAADAKDKEKENVRTKDQQAYCRYLAEQAAANPIRDGHQAELVTIHIGDVIVFGEPFVEEGESAVDEIEDAPVVMNHGFKEQLRLLFHGAAEIFIERGESVRVGFNAVQIAQLQPLAGEIIH